MTEKGTFALRTVTELLAGVTGGRLYSDTADVLCAKTNGAIPPPKRLRTLC